MCLCPECSSSSAEAGGNLAPFLQSSLMLPGRVLPGESSSSSTYDHSHWTGRAFRHQNGLIPPSVSLQDLLNAVLGSCCKSAREWLDGWMGGWTDKWLGGWVDGRIQKELGTKRSPGKEPAESSEHSLRSCFSSCFAVCQAHRSPSNPPALP